MSQTTRCTTSSAEARKYRGERGVRASGMAHLAPLPVIGVSQRPLPGDLRLPPMQRGSAGDGAGEGRGVRCWVRHAASSDRVQLKRALSSSSSH